ncbi:hypothetical protein JQ543_24435 [Bradyrhizobium diazoefficiens]|nr:hypothetical protein [Bradyrhizobium diazoefficiens]MBR0850912.1 hypothetical protein [Bradyrhizobium diazoefficiens]
MMVMPIAASAIPAVVMTAMAMPAVMAVTMAMAAANLDDGVLVRGRRERYSQTRRRRRR